MKCDVVQDKMLDFLDGSLENADQREISNHLETCKSCRKEVAVLHTVQNRMEEMHVPEISEEIGKGFYAMLDSYKEEIQPPARRSSWLAWKEKLRGLWGWQGSFPVAYTLIVLVIGTILGLLISPDKKYDQQLTTLNGEVQQMREMMLLTLLQQPSAADRLKAVSISNKLTQADEKVIIALLKTLNNDPNVNVRLVAVEALANMADYPQVRQGLIRSIGQQESPMVQIALADVMVLLQEKRSVDALRKVLKERKLNEAVKGKFEETIEILT